MKDLGPLMLLTLLPLLNNKGGKEERLEIGISHLLDETTD